MGVNGPKLPEIMKRGRLMLKRTLLTAVVCASVAPVHAANLKGEAVVLRTLDKVTATTRDYTVRVGDTLKYGSLTVDVKHCEKKPPEDTPETYAFLQIFDARSDGKGDIMSSEKVFSGWMLASKPAISALDHAVYDVWVIDCKLPN